MSDKTHADAEVADRSHRRIRRNCWTTVIVLVAAASGCGERAMSVHGTVQREGSALTRGKIVFTPVGGGKAASGDIQPDGTFRTTIERSGDVEPSGTYRIRVIESSESDRGRLFTSHVPPTEKTLEVGPGKTNEFDIHIRVQDGWKTSEDK